MLDFLARSLSNIPLTCIFCDYRIPSLVTWTNKYCLGGLGTQVESPVTTVCIVYLAPGKFCSLNIFLQCLECSTRNNGCFCLPIQVARSLETAYMLTAWHDIQRGCINICPMVLTAVEHVNPFFSLIVSCWSSLIIDWASCQIDWPIVQSWN